MSYDGRLSPRASPHTTPTGWIRPAYLPHSGCTEGRLPSAKHIRGCLDSWWMPPRENLRFIICTACRMIAEAELGTLAAPMAYQAVLLWSIHCCTSAVPNRPGTSWHRHLPKQLLKAARANSSICSELRRSGEQVNSHNWGGGLTPMGTGCQRRTAACRPRLSADSVATGALDPCAPGQCCSLGRASDTYWHTLRVTLRLIARCWRQPGDNASWPQALRSFQCLVDIDCGRRHHLSWTDPIACARSGQKH